MHTAMLVAVLAAGGAAEQRLSLSDGKWELEGQGTAVENVGGREVLRVETGTASRRDVKLQDGTIEFDVMVTRRRSFVYLSFRVLDDSEREEIYFRPHKSSLPDAVQYAPVYQDQSAWQLYHGPGATTALAFQPGAWAHVRLVLQGRRAALFYGEEEKPVMVVPYLAREPREGYLSLGSFLPPGTPGTEPPARFSNVVVRPGVLGFEFPPDPPQKAADPGVIRAWALSRSFAPKQPPPSVLPDATTSGEFHRVEAGAGGLLELHRFVRLPPGGRQTAAVARVRIRAALAGSRRLDLGYSDRVTVFLNGKPLYQGDAAYSFDAPRREGLIGYDQASVFLPLDAGENELAVLVSDGFGGWGLMGRFADPAGLTVEAR